jgi:hypothetical protein
MNRPRGITLTALLMALCNAMPWVTIDYGRPHVLQRFVIFTAVICTGYFVIWFYWKGRNWARIGVLLFSFGAIINLFVWNKLGPLLLPTPTHILLAARAILGVALVCYLNTRPVLEFFYPENRQTPLRYGWGRIVYGFWIVLSTVQNHSYLPGANSPGASHVVPTAPHTTGMLAAILVGLLFVAWGTRAGWVPYYPASTKSGRWFCAF